MGIDRRRLPRRRNVIWAEEQREAYRKRLLKPGPVMTPPPIKNVWYSAK